MILSKTDYMMFLRHPAWLWLKKNDPRRLPPIDGATQAMFDGGHLFERYAEQLFPDGTTLGFNGYDEYLSLPQRTKEAIDRGEHTLFQARFETGELTCICDVIQIQDDGAVDLIEIKSSTSAKEEHEFDLAFQCVVLEECGYAVRRIAVVHVNRAYVRQGEIVPEELTTTTELSEAVRARVPSTKRHIQQALSTSHASSCPDLSPAHARLGSLHDWLSIYRSLVDIDEGSIYDLCLLKAPQIQALEEQQITRLVDIPASFPLEARQTLQLTAVRGDAPLIAAAKLSEFLASLQFPLAFLDYETLMSVIPPFDGMSPYQQYPFQYSLHVLDADGGQLTHHTYLHAEHSDPTEALSAQLMADLPSSGTVVTWNMHFEKGCNERMGALHPKFAPPYRKLNDRIVDLMEPFRAGWYVDGAFKGSASIKNVLPVLVPSLSYAALDIHEGLTAQRRWMGAILDEKYAAERETILAELLEYCKLDTLAMVEIYRFLLEVVARTDDRRADGAPV